MNFINLAKVGRVPEGSGPGHLDGWGIGYYKQGRAVIEKSGLSILDEKDKVIDILKNIGETGILIFHLRKSAWEGTTDIKNAHPFCYKNVIFSHNGTIRDYQKLLEQINPNDAPAQDAKDTEVFFRYIMRNYTDDLNCSFHKAVETIKKENIYTAINCIFSEGSKMYVYREYTKEPDYYTLFETKQDKSIIVCSENISNKLTWQTIEKDSLQAYSL